VFLRLEGLADAGVPARRDVERLRITAVIVLLVLCVLLWRLFG
jgi:hypothetical protein